MFFITFTTVVTMSTSPFGINLLFVPAHHITSVLALLSDLIIRSEGLPTTHNYTLTTRASAQRAKFSGEKNTQSFRAVSLSFSILNEDTLTRDRSGASPDQ